MAAPHLPHETFLAMDFSRLLEEGVLAAVAAFFFVTLATPPERCSGSGMLGGLRRPERRPAPRQSRVRVRRDRDHAGRLSGTSPVTAYIESATGIEEGAAAPVSPR